MRPFSYALAALGLALALVTPLAAQTAPTVATRDDPQLGTILTDAAGWTLYLYTRDEPGVSNCYDQCAVNWPPLLVEGQPTAVAGLPGTLDVTIRRDGARQVTYDGWPLYYWINDTQPGDTLGQNVGGVWFVINPAPAAPAAGPMVTTRNDPRHGPILTDQDGWVLYLYTRDEPGVSNCYDQCAVNWPPLLVTGPPAGAAGLPGTLDVTIRRDGTQQVTYNGMPLYYWINDTQPGDTTGHEVGGVWFVVSP